MLYASLERCTTKLPENKIFKKCRRNIQWNHYGISDGNNQSNSYINCCKKFQKHHQIIFPNKIRKNSQCSKYSLNKIAILKKRMYCIIRILLKENNMQLASHNYIGKLFSCRLDCFLIIEQKRSCYKRFFFRCSKHSMFCQKLEVKKNCQ